MELEGMIFYTIDINEQYGIEKIGKKHYVYSCSKPHQRCDYSIEEIKRNIETGYWKVIKQKDKIHELWLTY